MENILERILMIEREMFERVQHCKVQFACRNGDFFPLRSGQFRAWSQELMESYCGDLLSAQAEGRNLLCEKHAYMMKRTAPDKYAEIKDHLPELSMEKLWLTDLICEASAEWLKELEMQYPHLMCRCGFIAAGEACEEIKFTDCLYGELLTYSVKTLRLYAALVDRMKKKNRNLWKQALENAASQQGFRSLEGAEEQSRIH